MEQPQPQSVEQPKAAAPQQTEQQAAPQTTQRDENTTKTNATQQKQITVSASFYVAMCSEGCTGITATGIDVRSTIYTNGLRIIAVDPAVIPLGSIVYVELSNGSAFKAIAGDTGGAIRGHKIDVLVSSESEARQLGKQTATITFL